MDEEPEETLRPLFHTRCFWSMFAVRLQKKYIIYNIMIKYDKKINRLNLRQQCCITVRQRTNSEVCPFLDLYGFTAGMQSQLRLAPNLPHGLSTLHFYLFFLLCLTHCTYCTWFEAGLRPKFTFTVRLKSQRCCSCLVDVAGKGKKQKTQILPFKSTLVPGSSC